jgi:Berberine and berberine like
VLLRLSPAIAVLELDTTRVRTARRCIQSRGAQCDLRLRLTLGVWRSIWTQAEWVDAWDDQQQHAEIAWARDFLASMRRWSVDQAPPNFLEPDEGTRRVRASFGEDKFRRLVALKDRYDPENVFRFNVNIRPSAKGPA